MQAAVYERAVTIRAPLGAVWAYVGESARAAEWSVYFDHIAPLPTSPVNWSTTAATAAVPLCVRPCRKMLPACRRRCGGQPCFRCPPT